jgi:hypothetical protein
MIYISGKMLDLKTSDLSDPAAKQVGVRSIDLKADLADIKKRQLYDAILGEGRFTLIERNEKGTTIASSNPSELWFYDEGTNNSMRFRAFKKRVWRTAWFYAKIGCEIETYPKLYVHDLLVYQKIPSE